MEKEQPWAHIDIAGVMESHGELPYLGKGMSGNGKESVCLTYKSCSLNKGCA